MPGILWQPSAGSTPRTAIPYQRSCRPGWTPVGRYALGLSACGALVQGTGKPRGLGMPVSHGLVRIYPEDIEQFFPKVPVATSVRMVDQPVKVGWRGHDLYLEAHAGDKTRKTPHPISSVDPSLTRRASNGTGRRGVERCKKYRPPTPGGKPETTGEAALSRYGLWNPDYLPMIFAYMRSRRSVLASQHACALFALSSAS